MYRSSPPEAEYEDNSNCDEMAYDLIIKNGTVLDGLSSEPFKADLGIAGGKIKEIGAIPEAKADRVIDAVGMYVCPGFIDIQNHSDSYFTLLEIPQLPSMVSQGITTIVVGQCGSSLAPLTSPEAVKSIQKWHSLAGLNLNWLKFEEFLSVLDAYPLGANVLSLAGHSTVRRGLIGDQVRAATPEEIKIAEKLFRESMDAGAAGISLGLVYAHEASAAEEELVSAAKVVADYNGLFSAHLRSESGHIIDSLNEVIGLAEKTKARLKISHFKVRGRENWNFIEEALGTLDRAYQKGVDVFFDVYPYTTSWTVLYTYLPKWAYEGGRGMILKNIAGKSTRDKILAQLRDQERGLGNVFIATSETNPALIGKTLAQVAANQEVSIGEALLNVVSATNTQVVVYDQNLSNDVLETLLKHPLSVIASDGVGYDFNFYPQHGLVHPRCFGTMPKFLSLVRDRKLMSWTEAVKKITSRPADKLGLSNRGRLAKGAHADVVVFDPNQIGSTATYENPYQIADGIEEVIVNGKLAFTGGELTDNQSGKVLRFG